MKALDKTSVVAVIGAGTMGSGIAQLVAGAGHPVLLFDAFAGAAEKGKARIAKGLEQLVSRGKFNAEAAATLLDRIVLAGSLKELAPSALVVEAILEDLGVKQTLFGELEAVVGPACILATNTSSISVTAIAQKLRHPNRCVGMHFFNPATIMKLVEVVSGVATRPEVAGAIHATATAWGKIAVHAKSTPGFIVNRVARSYYGEALRLYEEGLADPATIDALMTDAAGFRMGPFDLMDLIGNDVNYAVSVSVFNAFFSEPRFRPSIIQQELVNSGRLGRKSGAGFYDYAEGERRPHPTVFPAPDGVKPLSGNAFGEESVVEGVAITRTDGRTARALAKTNGRPCIVLDHVNRSGATRLAFAASPDVPDAWLQRFAASAAAAGIQVTQLPDWPGLLVMRTLATLANEGFEAVLQGVASEADVDTAMRYGVNYPAGPMERAREIGLSCILGVLDEIHRQTGDARYRPSLALRMAV